MFSLCALFQSVVHFGEALFRGLSHGSTHKNRRQKSGEYFPVPETRCRSANRREQEVVFSSENAARYDCPDPAQLRARLGGAICMLSRIPGVSTPVIERIKEVQECIAGKSVRICQILVGGASTVICVSIEIYIVVSSKSACPVHDGTLDETRRNEHQSSDLYAISHARVAKTSSTGV